VTVAATDFKEAAQSAFFRGDDRTSDFSEATGHYVYCANVYDFSAADVE
jgi:hypothetical protein